MEKSTQVQILEFISRRQLNNVIPENILHAIENGDDRSLLVLQEWCVGFLKNEGQVIHRTLLQKVLGLKSNRTAPLSKSEYESSYLAVRSLHRLLEHLE